MSIDAKNELKSAEPVEVEVVGTPPRKVSFRLPESDIADLSQIAAWRQSSLTEALRGAIATERYLREATRRGDRVILEDRDGHLREIVFHV